MLLSKLESFDDAKAYKAKLRPVEQPVYNPARLRETPIPNLSFASDESSQLDNPERENQESDTQSDSDETFFDDGDDISQNSGDLNNEHLTQNESGSLENSSANISTQFGSILVDSEADDSESSRTNQSCADMKDPLEIISLNETESAAFDAIMHADGQNDTDAESQDQSNVSAENSGIENHSNSLNDQREMDDGNGTF